MSSRRPSRPRLNPEQPDAELQRLTRELAEIGELPTIRNWGAGHRGALINCKEFLFNH